MSIIYFLFICLHPILIPDCLLPLSILVHIFLFCFCFQVGCSFNLPQPNIVSLESDSVRHSFHFISHYHHSSLLSFSCYYHLYPRSCKATSYFVLGWVDVLGKEAWSLVLLVSYISQVSLFCI